MSLCAQMCIGVRFINNGTTMYVYVQAEQVHFAERLIVHKLAVLCEP